MAITSESDRRKSNGRESNRRKRDKKIIKIEEEGSKEQEMTLRHEAVPKKKARLVWSGIEEFTWEWSETFVTKEREKSEKDENDYEHLRRKLIICPKRNLI